MAWRQPRRYGGGTAGRRNGRAYSPTADGAREWGLKAIPDVLADQCDVTGPATATHDVCRFEVLDTRDDMFFFFWGGGIKACGAVDERAHTEGLTGSGMEAKEVSLP